ncbi:MAG: dTDP-glucose 4,6-dehydratase [Candidatus Omnitrophica bacterium]|nr:dTDP-glucose 4,6-dehydratase [Candidatus Omnitrophota bacterium]
MRRKIHPILVTGGAGFIGSAFVRLAVKSGYPIIILDKLTYAGDLKRLEGALKPCKFYKADISDKSAVEKILKKHKPQLVVNFAAETHVDRSIRDAAVFLKTNVIGTQILLDASRKYGINKFVHISTDEVYGEITKGEFTECSAIKPNSPYAASKAAADLLINSYVRTYGFPAVIVRPCNNYGVWQYPEKLIPLSILKIFRGEDIPIYGSGRNVREWLYVDDCARGIMALLLKGKTGEVYNIGSDEERQNLDTIRMLLNVLGVSLDRIEFVKDRLGHDIRYRLNCLKTVRETGWRPKVNLEEGLKKTVSWAKDNRGWLLSKWVSVAPLYK